MGDLGSISETCDVFSASKGLTMRCRLGVPDRQPDLSPVWMYSSSSGDVVEGKGTQLNSTSAMPTASSSKVATLMLHPLVVGFYWCASVSSASDGYVHNPSRVIHITNSTCYPGVPCQDELVTPQSSFGRCAYGASIEQTAVILNLQNASACGAEDGNLWLCKLKDIS